MHDGYRVGRSWQKWLCLDILRFISSLPNLKASQQRGVYSTVDGTSLKNCYYHSKPEANALGKMYSNIFSHALPSTISYPVVAAYRPTEACRDAEEAVWRGIDTARKRRGAGIGGYLANGPCWRSSSSSTPPIIIFIGRWCLRPKSAHYWLQWWLQMLTNSWHQGKTTRLLFPWPFLAVLHYFSSTAASWHLLDRVICA